jgi:hypothetical protein
MDDTIDEHMAVLGVATLKVVMQGCSSKKCCMRVKPGTGRCRCYLRLYQACEILTRTLEPIKLKNTLRVVDR